MITEPLPEVIVVDNHSSDNDSIDPNAVEVIIPDKILLEDPDYKTDLFKNDLPFFR
jgi:hypothetical protein